MNDFYNVEFLSERVAALAKERDELKKLLKNRVEVIRCKDCKYWGGRDGNVFSCTREFDWFAAEPNDFCSHAEREE